MTKRCPKCDRTFENAVNFFPKNRSRKDGLGSWCFKCTNDASREDHQNYRADPKNKEHEAAFAKEYNSRPESKQKRKKNRARPEVKAKEAEAKKAYRATPEGKIVTAAYVKTRREDPIAAAIDKAARRIARQKDNLSPEALAWREDYRKENKERLKNQAQARHRWFKEQAINAYGGKCTCCGEDKIEFLAIDHVNNDGHIHRKQEPGAIGGNIYRWLAKMAGSKYYAITATSLRNSMERAPTRALSDGPFLVPPSIEGRRRINSSCSHHDLHPPLHLVWPNSHPAQPSSA